MVILCALMLKFYYRQEYGRKKQWTKGLGAISFILNKQKLEDLENMQAFLVIQIGVRMQMDLSLFLVDWFG